MILTRELGDRRVETLRRHRLWRRLSSSISRRSRRCAYWAPEDHRPDGPPWCDLQPYGGRLPATVVGSAAHCTSERPSRAPPPASSCCMRWMNRCVAGRAKGSIKKYEFWDFLSTRSSTTQGICRGALRAGSRPCQHGDSRLSRRCRPCCDSGGNAASSSVVATMSPGLQRQRGQSLRFSRALAKMLTASLFRCIPTAIPGADKLRLMSEIGSR